MPAPHHLSRILASLIAVIALGAPAQAGDGVAVLGYLPENTALVVTMNLDRARQTARGKRFITAMLGSDRAAQTIDNLRKQSGIAIERDLSTLVLAMAEDFEQSEDIYVAMQGRIDREDITAKAMSQARSFHAKKHRGVAYLTIDDETALAFIGRDLVATPVKTVTRVIDTYRGRVRSATRNARLMAMVQDARTRSDIWAAFVVPDKLRREIAQEAGGHSVHSVMARLDLKSGFAVQIRMEASSAAAASAIATLLRLTASDIAKRPRVVKYGLTTAVQTMKVRQSKRSIVAELTVPARDLATLEQALAGGRDSP
ncbi:MAG: hypothetical protein AAGC55_21045 [Myxococcota bacterium]